MSTAAVKSNGRKSKAARFAKTFLLRLAFYFLLCALSFIFLYPEGSMGLLYIFPAFRRMGFSRYIWNNVLVGAVATIGHMFSCALTGYAFARYNFKLKNDTRL